MVSPHVVSCREDLAFWVSENHGATIRLQRDGVEMDDPFTVRATLDNIKTQQQRVMDGLEHEQAALEEDLKHGGSG